jgi:hypothetical protein
MKYTEQELLDMKEEVNTAKTTVSELTGQKQVVVRQLKEDWECSNIKQAEAKIEAFDNRITSYNKKIEEGCLELDKLLETGKEEEE